MQQPPLTLPFSKSWPASFWGSRGSVPYLPIFSLHLGHICLHVELNSLGLEHLEGREGGWMEERGKEGRKDYSPCCIALVQSPPLQGCSKKPLWFADEGGPRRGLAEPWKCLSQVGTCPPKKEKGLHCSGTLAVTHHRPVVATIKESKL